MLEYFSMVKDGIKMGLATFWAIFYKVIWSPCIDFCTQFHQKAAGKFFLI
jgi:hypothetical protein